MRIAILGDSIAAGQHITIHKTWPSLLSAHFENEHTIQVFAQNGVTTKDIFPRFEHDIIPQSWDLLIIQFGLNDCNYWDSDFGLPRVSKEEYVNNIAKLVRKAYSAKVKNILVNTNHPTNKKGVYHGKISYQDSNLEYRDYLINLAYLLNFKINDIYGHRLIRGMQLRDLLLADGIHLSELGHEVYFEIHKKLIIDLAVSEGF